MNRNRLVFVAGVAAICIFILLSVVVLRFVGERGAAPEGGATPAPTAATTTPPAGGAPASPNAALGDPSDASPDASNKNNYLLVKPQYVLSYNDERGGPNWVSWRLVASDIGDVERQDNFHPEQSLPAGFRRVAPNDYTGSGYDRGHVCNSKDRTATPADNSETFSMANMLPQTPDLNRHVWESLESYSRALARKGNQLYIVAGGYGSAGTIGRSNKVTVPTNCWKVILVLPEGRDPSQADKNARVIAVDMPNANGIAQDTWEKYATTVRDIEQKTGYRFFTRLTRDVQDALKSKKDSGR
ncbi:MAG TPA: DNA/RNA non-specific endonuclease [Pyrinomonadaceae bacterium]|jgi:endonuclease G|nr:DNA/RNA non-specific endonuclease [Pyrinomonadaceae bacterium]